MASNFYPRLSSDTEPPTPPPSPVGSRVQGGMQVEDAAEFHDRHGDPLAEASDLRERARVFGQREREYGRERRRFTDLECDMHRRRLHCMQSAAWIESTYAVMTRRRAA